MESIGESMKYNKNIVRIKPLTKIIQGIFNCRC
jgi:hypothetical protein